MSITLKIQKLDKSAILPNYANHDDAGLDLYSNENVTLKPGERFSVATGVAIEIPKGYVGLIWDKSGLSHNFGLKTLGGVVDAGFRGEVKVGIVNLSKKVYKFEKGHKVAQMVIQKKESVKVKEVTSLADSQRGKKGFGSSGK
ncbi:MAG: dUTP diphosphatase [Candidatus Paceibacterota bacterium]